MDGLTITLFSPGTTNDDRINFDWWEDVSQIETVIHTEKLDGENTCLNQYGVFARLHAAPTMHPWANYLKERWSWMKHDLSRINYFLRKILPWIMFRLMILKERL